MRLDVLQKLIGAGLMTLGLGGALAISRHKETRQSPKEAAVEIVGERQIITASETMLFTVTNVGVSYISPIDEVETARVKVKVTQARRAIRSPRRTGELVDTDPYAGEDLGTLEWPISLALSSAAFEFGDGDNERKLPRKTRLPAEVSWSATPKQAGDWDMKLKLSGAFPRGHSIGYFASQPSIRVTTNGASQVVDSERAISLPIEVYKAPGIPARWMIIGEWAASLLTFLVGGGVFAGLAPILWRKIFGVRSSFSP